MLKKNYVFFLCVAKQQNSAKKRYLQKKKFFASHKTKVLQINDQTQFISLKFKTSPKFDKVFEKQTKFLERRQTS